MRQVLKQGDQTKHSEDIVKNSQSGPMHRLKNSSLGGKRATVTGFQLVLCLIGGFVPDCRRGRTEGGKRLSISKELD